MAILLSVCSLYVLCLNVVCGHVLFIFVVFFFFFKQKTAYEMRISDWSSDVCSSDLPEACARPGTMASSAMATSTVAPWPRRVMTAWRVCCCGCLLMAGSLGGWHGTRSEEHTSELQSLMRISYAVFCLKKKNTIDTQRTHTLQQYMRPDHTYITR